MTESTQKHWTDEDELLEQFVLHRLSRQRQRELDHHLRNCAQCRERVQAESYLIGVIRHAGRAEFKKKLRQEISLLAPPPLSLHKVLTIAAVLAVVLTAGITGLWLVRQREASSVAGHPAITQSLPSEGAKKTERTGEGSSGTQIDRGQQTLGGVPGRESVKGQMAHREIGIKRSENKTKSMSAPPLAASRVGASHETLNEAPGKRPTRGTAGFATLSSAPVKDSVWIDGNILPDQQFGRGQTRATSRKRGDENAAGTGIVLKQLPSSAIPVRSQSDRERNVTYNPRVRALIQRLPTGNQVTLYLDTLMSENELQLARIESVNADSIIIETDRLRIGFRLPPGWALPQKPDTVAPR